MTEKSPSQQISDEISQRAQVELEGINYSPFSASAFDILKGKVNQYIFQLINESIDISKRHGTDLVSANHVQKASENLIAHSSSRYSKYFIALGGICLGAFLSPFQKVISGTALTPNENLFMIIVGLLGIGLLSWSIAKE